MMRERELPLEKPPGAGGGSGGRVHSRVVQADRRAFRAAKLYKAALVVATCVLLVLVSFTQNHLNMTREKLGLTRLPPLENMPPVLAFTTVALGAFRGLIANMLWIRANDMQEEDKYFEMVQLSDWITKLQPHFVSVWVHQAWNMSYNISIKFSDPADRWPWVRRGIELLRDEALRYNPNEPLIYRELAWHFQHKMGADLDDAHHYYKALWVDKMTEVLGAQPNLDELINPQTDDARARAALLRETYKMNPEWMKEVDERYGPLEWRLPESQAIYWAYLALNKTDERKVRKEDLIACRRVIFQALQLSFRRGRIVYPDKTKKEFFYAPNLDVVAKANSAYEEMIEHEEQMAANFGTAHRNFLKWATYYLYVYGRTTEASKWWKYMHAKYPGATPEGQSLDQYAFERAQETLGETSHDDAKAVIEGFLRNAFVALALDEDDVAFNYDRFAYRFWERFQTEIGDVSRDRVGLPFPMIKEGVLAELLEPETGLEPYMAARLRTKLGLPAGATGVSALREPTSATSTNAPPGQTSLRR
jgi:hypothetical protein